MLPREAVAGKAGASQMRRGSDLKNVTRRNAAPEIERPIPRRAKTEKRVAFPWERGNCPRKGQVRSVSGMERSSIAMTGAEATSWTQFLPVTLASILFISQIAIGILLLSRVDQIKVLAYLGAATYALSGVVFGWLPMGEFRRRGGVKEGESYMKTTRLVDTGVYSIVRHPQYVTFILWAIAGMLLFQHWIVILLGIPVIPLVYIDLIKADEDAIEKFGDDYRRYMERVPRSNFLLGIIRRIRRAE